MFLDISSFLEEISSLSHSMCFFPLFTQEGLLVSPGYFLELCIQLGYIFPFLQYLSLPFFLQLLGKPPETTLGLPAFLFHGDGFGPCLLYSIMNLNPQFFRHSVC